MAIQLCSEESGIGMSPRISFSHDLCLSDVVPIEQNPNRSNSPTSSIDFDFCVHKSFDLESSSSADELFSDGKILPTEIKRKSFPDPSIFRSPPPPLHSPHDCRNCDSKAKSESEIAKESSEGDEKQNSKSFWRFKRSNSLNCGSSYGRSLCPLPLLSRSNSTGSADSGPNVKRSHKHDFQKHGSGSYTKSSQSSSSSSYQKPPLKKNYGGHGNGIRVNPVLNVASVNLFGIGSIFSNGKDKNRKK